MYDRDYQRDGNGRAPYGRDGSRVMIVLIHYLDGKANSRCSDRCSDRGVLDCSYYHEVVAVCHYRRHEDGDWKCSRDVLVLFDIPASKSATDVARLPYSPDYGERSHVVAT